MPELPEVETVKRQLNEALAGKKIISIELYKTGREEPFGQAFVDQVVGKKINQIDRRAKLLIWRFKGGDSMLAHLKMTGRFLLLPKDAIPTKHDRMKFLFEDVNDMCVMWQDIRTFGYVKLVDQTGLEKALSIYGLEPLEASTEELAACFPKKSKRKIKAALLDQSVVAGVGNIYADEVCFAAGIHPSRLLNSLSDTDKTNIATEIKRILNASLDNKGTTIVNYMNSTGGKGEFSNFLKVYGKEGEKCDICESVIEKTVTAGRGTHFCPTCQK